MRVCVIGAGAAGLCAARHAVNLRNLEKLVVLEQTDSIGGTWVYTESVGRDKHDLPIHSSMYKNLKTNLPKEVMAFPDFPFDKQHDSFMSHQTVLQYLQDYANHFNLNGFIRNRTAVTGVECMQQAEKEIWRVQSKYLPLGTIETEDFDVLYVCNGHYSKPKIAEIEGLNEFSGRILHSHNYRNPEDFSGQIVACLGAGNSGIDIAVELSETCIQILYSVAIVEGRCRLPSKTEMFEWEREDYRWKMEKLKLRKTKAHYLGSFQWDYNRNLCKLGGFACPIPPVVERIFQEVQMFRKKNVVEYKKAQFELTNGNEFRILS